MPGTRAGGLKACQTNKERYGEDFYKRIGSDGGSVPTVEKNENGNNMKGFAINPDLASRAGQKGGRISRRGKAKK